MNLISSGRLIEQGLYRLECVKTLDALQAQGKSWPECSSLIGVSVATLWRWRNTFKAQGKDGLFLITRGRMPKGYRAFIFQKEES